MWPTNMNVHSNLREKKVTSKIKCVKNELECFHVFDIFCQNFFPVEQKKMRSIKSFFIRFSIVNLIWELIHHLFGMWWMSCVTSRSGFNVIAFDFVWVGKVKQWEKVRREEIMTHTKRSLWLFLFDMTIYSGCLSFTVNCRIFIIQSHWCQLFVDKRMVVNRCIRSKINTKNMSSFSISICRLLCLHPNEIV